MCQILCGCQKLNCFLNNQPQKQRQKLLCQTKLLYQIKRFNRWRVCAAEWASAACSSFDSAFHEHVQAFRGKLQQTPTVWHILRRNDLKWQRTSASVAQNEAARCWKVRFWWRGGWKSSLCLWWFSIPAMKNVIKSDLFPVFIWQCGHKSLLNVTAVLKCFNVCNLSVSFVLLLPRVTLKPVTSC